MSRIEMIRKIVEQQPNDPFPRYGLAMELKNLGQLEESSVTFAELERRHPAYVAQYLMHANVLTALRRTDDAKGCLRRGIEVARQAGNGHALSEMQTALADLDAQDD